MSQFYSALVGFVRVGTPRAPLLLSSHEVQFHRMQVLKHLVMGI